MLRVIENNNAGAATPDQDKPRQRLRPPELAVAQPAAAPETTADAAVRPGKPAGTRRCRTRRVLGIGDYKAQWVGGTQTVRITATGVLPCANYFAQLERREVSAAAPIWDMVFFIHDRGEPGAFPFEAAAYAVAGEGAATIGIRDAAGSHEILIRPAAGWAGESSRRTQDPAQYLVYARLPKPRKGHHGCMIVPEGTFVTSLHYRAFGPAGQMDCERFVEQSNLPGGGRDGRFSDTPWPALPGQ